MLLKLSFPMKLSLFQDNFIQPETPQEFICVFYVKALSPGTYGLELLQKFKKYVRSLICVINSCR